MGSIPSERRFKADSVCIIGAGPSGLAAAKYLIAEKAFSKIVIYEQRSKTGGLWNYLPCNDGSAKVPVPQTNPHAGHAEPVWGQVGQDGNVSEESDFVSPVYERLETNIPRGLMGFSDLDWDEDRQLFPKHEDVLNYIQTYGEEVSHLIRFRTQVLDVRLRPDEKWTVTTTPISQSNSSQEPTQETFDAVICANGHYEVPYIPQVPGISTFHKTHPNIISHSKFYRKPEAYTNKKVIIVGNSASGIDIGSQIERVCKLPLIISQKSESYLNVEGSKPSKLEKPEIIEYIPHNKTVKFSDGTIEKDIDAVVYCTGYFYSYPFLNSLDPPILTTGERVENTYQHIFYAPNPTLSFLVLNQKVIPFPMAEVQSAVIARVLSGRLTLPSVSEMKSWEEGVEKEMGTGRNFHVLKFPRDAEMINFLGEWARSADGEEGEDGVGKKPPRWGEKEFYTRERFPNIKSAFNALGEGRYQVRRLEEVGFDFEKWRAEAREEGN